MQSKHRWNSVDVEIQQDAMVKYMTRLMHEYSKSGILEGDIQNNLQ